MSLGDYIDKYMIPSSPTMSQVAVGAAYDEDDDVDSVNDDDVNDEGVDYEDDDGDEEDEDDDEARGYLAQHPLFDQVPSLRADIMEPSLCAAVCPEDLAAPADCEVRLSTRKANAASAAAGKSATNSYNTTSNNETAGSKEGEEEVLGPLVSAWFGPSGTVSPLHNDPYHNLLCQVNVFDLRVKKYY